MRARSTGFLAFCWAFWVLALPAAAAPQARQELQILAADVPPLSFMSGGRMTGFCIDLIDEIQRRIGSHAPIRRVPWTRAYKAAQEQPGLVLVCPKRVPEREALFKWVGPLRISAFNLYVRGNSPLRLHSLQDAREADGVLMPRESFIYRHLSDEGFANLEPVNNSMMALRMLMAGRRSLMAVDQEQLPTLLDLEHLEAGAVELAWKLLPSHSYLAFSRGTPDPLIAAWQRALDAMKTDGSFARLHRQWFPKEEVSARLLRPADGASAPAP